MIESKLKAKNCNRGQPFRPCWVSSARCSKLYEVFSWSTEIHILTKYRWWWPQMKLKSKIFANWPVSLHHYVYCPVFFWGRTVGLSDPACCSFLTWFGYDFPAGQFVSVRSFLIAATKWYSGVFPVVPSHAFCMWHWPIGKDLDLTLSRRCPVKLST